MQAENLNINDLMASRRHAVEETLSTISVEELRALTEDLFPSVDHPWLEKFLEIINDPASGTFYHALWTNACMCSTATTRISAYGLSAATEKGLWSRRT